MRIRAVNAADIDAYRSILERTTDEDRYCRFFHAVDHFDLRELRRFVETSDDMIGLIAEDDRGPLGVAHAFYLEPALAEVAVVVAGDARCLGVGHRLMERLIEAVRARGACTLRAFALSLNGPFAHLARSVGMTPGSPSDVVTWTVHVDTPGAQPA